MSFGFYRPAMGVSGGHRELCSNRSLHDQRRVGEQMLRQENPITGHSSYHGAPGKPPSGNLGIGLLPTKGPLDHMTVADKDVPAKRVDPSKNHSANLIVGSGCVAQCDRQPPRAPSRITESAFIDGLGMREATPERRRTPGQVVRSGIRPKDSLQSGCVASERCDHPLGLQRKAGSAGAGIGSGGCVHIVAGPNGFVPAGPPELEVDLGRQGSRDSGAIPFRRVCGAGSVLRSSSARAVC